MKEQLFELLDSNNIDYSFFDTNEIDIRLDNYCLTLDLSQSDSQVIFELIQHINCILSKKFCVTELLNKIKELKSNYTDIMDDVVEDLEELETIVESFNQKIEKF